MTPAACPRCACHRADGARQHRLLVLLDADDLDAALEEGLLGSPPCPGCNPACAVALATARDGRLDALAARGRHRARSERLHRRKTERDAKRGSPTPSPSTPALPTAAAEVLSRALAKARTPR